MNLFIKLKKFCKYYLFINFFELLKYKYNDFFAVMKLGVFINIDES